LGTDGVPDLTRAKAEPAEGVTYCARHPQVETGLLCGRCGTPICPRCLVQTPVGARCRTCANVRRLPTVDVKPVFIARGLGAGLASGIAIGAVWGFIVAGSRTGFAGFFIIFVAIAIGWAVGEAVSAATNRKRSPVLQACAVVGVIAAYVVHNLVGGTVLLPAGDFWGYVATGLAAVYAASRLRA
jgi:hypothetical protein